MAEYYLEFDEPMVKKFSLPATVIYFETGLRTTSGNPPTMTLRYLPHYLLDAATRVWQITRADDKTYIDIIKGGSSFDDEGDKMEQFSWVALRAHNV